MFVGVLIVQYMGYLSCAVCVGEWIDFLTIVCRQQCCTTSCNVGSWPVGNVPSVDGDLETGGMSLAG